MNLIEKRCQSTRSVKKESYSKDEELPQRSPENSDKKDVGKPICKKGAFCAVSVLGLSFALFGLLTLPIFSQETAPARKPLRKVYEVMTADEIRRIEEAAREEDADPNVILAQARTLLDRYYSQFLDDKRTFDERRTALYDPRNWNANHRRLLRLARSKRTDPGFFLGHAPYLRRLFLITARAYQKKKDAARAMWAYSMALRYGLFESDLSLEKEAARKKRTRDKRTNTQRTNRQEKKPIPLRQKEAEYLKMLRGFASKDRVAQEEDPAIQEAARELPGLLQEYQKAKEDCKSFAKSVYAAEANEVRGIAQKRSSREWARLRKERCADRDSLLSQLEDIRKNSYKKYLKRRGQEAGNAAYEMALLAKEMHQKEQKRQRLLNKGNYLRGAGELLKSNRTSYRNFAAYGSLLELAHFFDPANLKYIDLIVEQKRRENRPEVALAYQELYLEIAEAQVQNEGTEVNLSQTKLALQYKRLAEIQSGLRRYVPATEALEKALRLLQTNRQNSDEKLQKTSFEIKKNLSDLFFFKTGNIRRAEELYREELKTFLDLSPVARKALGEEGLWKRRTRAYLVSERLAQISRKKRKSKEEEAHLKQADIFYKEMQEEKKLLEAEHKERLDELRALKEELRKLEEEPDDGLNLRYYRLLRVTIPALKKRLGQMTRRMQQLKHPRLLKRLSEIQFQNKRFRECQETLRRILAEGNTNEASLARRNLLRVEQILSDGILRPLLRK